MIEQSTRCPPHSQDGRTRPAVPQASLHQPVTGLGTTATVLCPVPRAPWPPGLGKEERPHLTTPGGSRARAVGVGTGSPPIDLSPWPLLLNTFLDCKPRATRFTAEGVQLTGFSALGSLRRDQCPTFSSPTLASPSPPSAGLQMPPPWTFGCTRQPGAAVGGLTEAPKVHPMRTSPKREPGRTRQQMHPEHTADDRQGQDSLAQRWEGAGSTGPTSLPH